VRVIIYDDQLLFSEAIASLFAERGHEVVGFPTTTEDALRMVQTIPADACLVEMSPGRSASATGIAVFKQVAPDLPIIVLTSDSDVSHLLQAVEAGAAGICMRVDGIDEVERVLVRAVALTESGSSSTVVWSRMAESLARRPPTAKRRSTGLTPREEDVLQALVRGSNTAEIAAEVGINEATVRTHIQHLFHKFGAHSRLALVASAIRADVVQVGEGAEIVVARTS
jgi:DNA-binding NarL/FixJ family response regulator